MKKEELKDTITNAVLNFLNDDRIVKNSKDNQPTERPIFKKIDGNTFGLNKKDN